MNRDAAGHGPLSASLDYVRDVETKQVARGLIVGRPNKGGRKKASTLGRRGAGQHRLRLIRPTDWGIILFRSIE